MYYTVQSFLSLPLCNQDYFSPDICAELYKPHHHTLLNILSLSIDKGECYKLTCLFCYFLHCNLQYMYVYVSNVLHHISPYTHQKTTLTKYLLAVCRFRFSPRPYLHQHILLVRNIVDVELLVLGYYIKCSVRMSNQSRFLVHSVIQALFLKHSFYRLKRNKP